MAKFSGAKCINNSTYTETVTMGIVYKGREIEFHYKANKVVISVCLCGLGLSLDHMSLSCEICQVQIEKHLQCKRNMEKTSLPQGTCTSLPGCYNKVSLGAQLLSNKIHSLTALEVTSPKQVSAGPCSLCGLQRKTLPAGVCWQYLVFLGL